MNIVKIIEEIEKIDPEISDRMNPRRTAIRNIGNLGSKIAAAGLPLALASMFKKAYGQQTPAAINDVLNFALTLEYLEAEFYTMGVANTALMAQGTLAGTGALSTIRDHENQHVAFLKSVLGAAAVSKPTFDFTAKGTFPTVFSNYDTFLAVAQAFEDTGVRAYKGQAPALLGNKVVLTAALNIHSVEARHAAHIRYMRRSRGGAAASLKPWITGSNDSGIGAAVNNVYAGEDNVNQAGVTTSSLPGVGGNISLNAATEAFDEPLTKAQVLSIVTPFIV